MRISSLLATLAFVAAGFALPAAADSSRDHPAHCRAADIDITRGLYCECQGHESRPDPDSLLQGPQRHLRLPRRQDRVLRQLHQQGTGMYVSWG